MPIMGVGTCFEAPWHRAITCAVCLRTTPGAAFLKTHDMVICCAINQAVPFEDATAGADTTGKGGLVSRLDTPCTPWHAGPQDMDLADKIHTRSAPTLAEK